MDITYFDITIVLHDFRKTGGSIATFAACATHGPSAGFSDIDFYDDETRLSQTLNSRVPDPEDDASVGIRPLTRSYIVYAEDSSIGIPKYIAIGDKQFQELMLFHKEQIMLFLPSLLHGEHTSIVIPPLIKNEKIRLY